MIRWGKERERWKSKNKLFFVNLPFGVSAVCLLAIGHRENRIKHKLIIDWPGAITLCGSVIAILLA
ncbi:hypothetical protein ABHN11_23290 [Brevibacillus centrosporus]|uniref:hypothetical protein n=1 Tax=Brevibacillus centrosporus TaxID=54910 RepID=UPI003D224010